MAIRTYVVVCLCMKHTLSHCTLSTAYYVHLNVQCMTMNYTGKWTLLYINTTQYVILVPIHTQCKKVPNIRKYFKKVLTSVFPSGQNPILNDLRLQNLLSL